MNGECRYCGKTFTVGHGCIASKDDIHEMVPDNPDVCVRCGSTNYGPSCQFPHPDNKGKNYHKHGIGDNKCVWCGTKVGKNGVPVNSPCRFSPTGKHSLA